MEKYEIPESTQKLTEALFIALEAHKNQVDKGGHPYILHPLRLMMQFKEEELQIIALLHDVVEDSLFTLDDLKRKGFKKTTIEAIDALTKRVSESYQDFIGRVAKNELARKVKILDLKDNLNLERLPELHNGDFKRIEKYHNSLKYLVNYRSECWIVSSRGGE